MGGNSTSKLPMRIASSSMLQPPRSPQSISPATFRQQKLPYLELDPQVSDDADMHVDPAEELKEALPDDLKQYCNSIEMTYNFWCNEIETLSQDEYKEAAVLLYVNVFKAIPETRRLFPKTIEVQAKQFFSMFRWLITNLRRPDSARLISGIKMLGHMHQQRGIKPEWFKSFLDAFHETMHETFKEKYTSRMRFCFEQLYTVVMNIMLDLDFHSLSSAKIARLLKALHSLEHCLADQEACIYLQLYMEQQFCVELMLFYKECRRFRRCLSDIVRQSIGKGMMTQFIDRGSECEINISCPTKTEVYGRLQENNNVFEIDVFDTCCAECVELMRRNTWNGFKSSIMKMAVDEDMRYDEMKDAQSLLSLQRARSVPRPSMTALSLHRKSSF